MMRAADYAAIDWNAPSELNAGMAEAFGAPIFLFFAFLY